MNKLFKIEKKKAVQLVLSLSVLLSIYDISVFLYISLSRRLWALPGAANELCWYLALLKYAADYRLKKKDAHVQHTHNSLLKPSKKIW